MLDGSRSTGLVDGTELGQTAYLRCENTQSLSMGRLGTCRCLIRAL